MSKLELIKNKILDFSNVVLQSAWQVSSTFPNFCNNWIDSVIFTWLQPLLFLGTLTFYTLEVVLPFALVSHFLVVNGLLTTHFMDWFQNFFISNPELAVMALSTLFIYIQLYWTDVDIIEDFIWLISNSWHRYNGFMREIIYEPFSGPRSEFYSRVLFTFFYLSFIFPCYLVTVDFVCLCLDGSLITNCLKWLPNWSISSPEVSVPEHAVQYCVNDLPTNRYDDITYISKVQECISKFKK